MLTKCIVVTEPCISTIQDIKKKKKKLYLFKNSQCLQIVSTKLINIIFFNKAAKKHLTICIDVKEQSTT